MKKWRQAEDRQGQAESAKTVLPDWREAVGD